MKEFKIGDNVKITNRGSIYTVYLEMAKKMNLKNWISGWHPKKEDDKYGRIVAIEKCPYAGPNRHDGEIRYGIETKSAKSFIANGSCLEKTRDSIILIKDDMFII